MHSSRTLCNSSSGTQREGGTHVESISVLMCHLQAEWQTDSLPSFQIWILPSGSVTHSLNSGISELFYIKVTNLTLQPTELHHFPSARGQTVSQMMKLLIRTLRHEWIHWAKILWMMCTLIFLFRKSQIYEKTKNQVKGCREVPERDEYLSQRDKKCPQITKNRPNTPSNNGWARGWAFNNNFLNSSK